jgi:hypothetical protein
MHMAEETKQADPMTDYRKWLIAAEQKSQEDFDKTVLSLSGGALGISFVFLKDVIGPQPLVLSGFLLAAWLTWAFSTFSVLTSFYLSHLALRRAIAQVDDGTIHKQQPGGIFAFLTAVLNATGAVLFLVGVCCITVFAGANLSTKGATNGPKETSITSTASDATTETTAITAPNTKTGRPGASNGGVHSAPSTPTAPKK